jgi:hypothetical protein
MVKNIPARLYKFQTYDSYSIENLKRDQIWFSKPDKLNDPFDCSIPFVFDWTDDEFEKFYDWHFNSLKVQGKNAADAVKSLSFTNGKPNKKYKDYVIKTNEYYMRLKIINEINQMGVACFTENLESILMWSHYADRHKGFCIEFDTNYPPFSESEKLQRVIYSRKYPTLSVLDIMQPESEYMPIDILITKSKSWKYEKEWRLIIVRGDNPYKYNIEALKAIYFGCSMPNKQMRQLATIFTKSDIRLFRMQRSYSEFNLVPMSYHE